MRSVQKVLVLGGNDAQVPYIKRLKALGYWVALADLNKSCPGKKICDHFKAVSYEDKLGLLEYIDELKFDDKCKIFTAAAQFSNIGAASVAAKLKVPYPTLSTVEMCLDKVKFYQQFESAGIPIPKTKIIKRKADLDSILKNADRDKKFYLKSDYSKNPNYIHRLGIDDSLENIFWGRDKFLRNAYVFQEEVVGTHIRINIFAGKFNLFDFSTNQLLTSERDICNFRKHNIDDTLYKFLEIHGLSNFLVKFDLVVNDHSWVALDIGLDPPSRMKKHAEEKKIKFVDFYIDLYMEGKFLIDDLKELIF